MPSARRSGAEAIERLPVLRQYAQNLAATLERGGADLVAAAARQVAAEGARFERATVRLGAQIDSARARGVQNRWLAGAGGAGIVVGMLLLLILPRALPFSAAERVATFVLGQEPWEAGIRLMNFENPVWVERLGEADRLARANAEVLRACRAAVAKTAKDQPCTITVPVSGR